MRNRLHFSDPFQARDTANSSGRLCLFEEHTGLLLTGDTVLSSGILGGVFGSGNISDTVYSLEILGSLRATRLLPGHGRCPDAPPKDIDRALKTCQGHCAISIAEDNLAISG